MNIKRNQSLEAHAPLGMAVVLASAHLGASSVLAFAICFAVGVAIELAQGLFPALGAAEPMYVAYTAGGGVAGFALLVLA